MHGPRSARERASPSVPFVLAFVTGSAIGAGLAMVVLAGPLIPLGVPLCACPAAWALGSPSHVPPGAAGCLDRSGEVCYSVTLVSNIGGVHLSGLRFELLGPPTNVSNVLSGRPIELGPSAIVSVLDPSGNTVGVWNWTVSSWTVGGGWSIPARANISLVVDSGLQSVQLAGDTFWVFMVTPNYGAVGAGLV
jgi:hypothetical protein